MPMPNTDDLARRYLAGESLQALAKSVGVCGHTIKDRLTKAGVKILSKKEALSRAKRIPLDVKDIVRRYTAGETEHSIALSLGVARTAIRKRLLESGCKLRTFREAFVLYMAKTTKEQRLRFTEAAHAAVRGKRQTLQHRCKIALSRERSPKLSIPESQFLSLISERTEVVPQKAEGPYNIDFALTEGRIAVEIFGGHWHKRGRHAGRYRKRMDYLLDAGWLPVIIWTRGEFPARAVEYVVALNERRRSGETFPQQEHVIRSTGKLVPAGQFDFNNGSPIPSRKP